MIAVTGATSVLLMGLWIIAQGNNTGIIDDSLTPPLAAPYAVTNPNFTSNYYLDQNQPSQGPPAPLIPPNRNVSSDGSIIYA